MAPLDLLTVPGILALVEIVKRLGVPGQFAPLVAVVVGAGLSLLVSGVSIESAAQGLVLGLSASGLWSGTKAVVGK